MKRKCACGGIIVTEPVTTRHNCFSNVTFWGTLDVVEYDLTKVGRRYCIKCKETH